MAFPAGAFLTVNHQRQPFKLSSAKIERIMIRILVIPRPKIEALFASF
jgi:hypothetical protein